MPRIHCASRAKRLRRSDRAGNTSGLRRAYLVANQAYAQVLNGSPAQASLTYRAAVDLLAGAGRAESTLGASVYNDWAIALWSAGDPRRRSSNSITAWRSSERRSPTGDASASFYGNRAQALRALVVTTRRLPASSVCSGCQRRTTIRSFEVYALAGQALVAAKLRRLDDARQRVSDAEGAAASGGVARGGRAGAVAAHRAGGVFQLAGQLADADQVLAEAEATYAKRQARTGVVAEVGIVRSEIALALGQNDAARSRSRTGAGVARKGQGDLPQSFLTGRALLALTRSDLALGAAVPAREAMPASGRTAAAHAGHGASGHAGGAALARELGA